MTQDQAIQLIRSHGISADLNGQFSIRADNEWTHNGYRLVSDTFFHRNGPKTGFSRSEILTWLGY